jgi:outer membrane autotransporter protein
MKKNTKPSLGMMALFLLFTLFAVTESLAAETSGVGNNPPAPPRMPPGDPVIEPPEPPTPSVTPLSDEERSPQRLKVNVKQISTPVGDHAARSVSIGRSSNDTFRKPLIRIGAMETNDSTGISAGEQGTSLPRWGIWTNFSYTSTDDSNPSTEADGDLYDYIIGADYKISEKIVVGLTLTYEDMKTTTTYNSGEVNSDGYTLTPYFAMQINDYFGFDVNGGYSRISLDQTRNDEGFPITSSPDADRYFFAMNANGNYKIKDWNFAGNLGYIYAKEDQDSFIESNGYAFSSSTVKLGQIYCNVEAAYSFESVEPHLNLGYEYDTTYDQTTDTFGEPLNDNLDPDGFTAGIGMRFLLVKSLQGDIRASGIFGRNNYDEYTLVLNLRYDF